MEKIDIESLKPQHELYINWNTDYQSWHDRWWDPISSLRTYIDTAGLIPDMMQEKEQWAIVPLSVGGHFAKSDRFVVQRLSEPAPERTCYKAIHKYPTISTLESLRILEQYIRCDEYFNLL